MARNLLQDGYDFISVQSYAANDHMLKLSVAQYTVAELKPVLKANGVKGISKMRKADMIDAIVELAHQKKAEREQAKAKQAASEPVQETSNAAALRAFYRKYTLADLKKILVKHNVKGRSKLTKKADIIETIIEISQANIKQIHDELAYMPIKQLREYAEVSISQIAEELHFSEKTCREAENDISGDLSGFAHRAAIKAYLIGCITDKLTA